MSYYPTIEEDITRAKEILARGKPHAIDLELLPCICEVPNSGTTSVCPRCHAEGGTIYGADTYAAYKLLESFVAEIARQHADLIHKGTLLAKFYDLFSDYEEPCETFEQAEAIWNDMRAADAKWSEYARSRESQILTLCNVLGVEAEEDLEDAVTKLLNLNAAMTREIHDIEAVLHEAVPGELLGDTLAREVVERMAQRERRMDELIAERDTLLAQKARVEEFKQQILDQQRRAENAELALRRVPFNDLERVMWALPHIYEGGKMEDLPEGIRENGLVQRAMFYRAGVELRPTIKELIERYRVRPDSSNNRLKALVAGLEKAIAKDTSYTAAERDNELDVRDLELAYVVNCPSCGKPAPDLRAAYMQQALRDIASADATSTLAGAVAIAKDALK